MDSNNDTLKDEACSILLFFDPFGCMFNIPILYVAPYSIHETSFIALITIKLK